MKRSGFTLFELLAVLTLISIVLVSALGAFGSWGTAHAVEGAAAMVEAGLCQARSLAISRNQYVVFEYGSYTTNQLKTVTGYQVYLCTNENHLVADVLKKWSDSSEPTALELEHLVLAAPPGSLSGHVRLANVTEDSASHLGTLVFRPNGSVWSWDDKGAHYVKVTSAQRFSRGENKQTESMVRLVRVDLLTGRVTVAK